MEIFDLEYGLRFLAGQGHTLNVEELTAINSGLSKKQSDEKLDKIYFWGKVFGSTSDYYVAYGIREDESQFEFPTKSFFYATDNFEFTELPTITEEDADKIAELLDAGKVAMQLAGEPGAPLEPPAEGGEGEGEGADAAEPVKVLTEQHRLAQLVAEIDYDTAVVPSGAYVLNEAHQVKAGTNFKGLSFSAAQDLNYYMHMRPAASLAKLRALASDETQFYANFLDPLTEDLPKGCWAVRTDPSSSFVSLRSLVWPGYAAYHVPGTPRFGGIYFGHALKNRDLPFLL